MSLARLLRNRKLGKRLCREESILSRVLSQYATLQLASIFDAPFKGAFLRSGIVRNDYKCSESCLIFRQTYVYLHVDG